MGKNKWIEELDTGQNSGYRSTGRAGAYHNKKVSHMPAAYNGRTVEAKSPIALLKESFRRFRRKWLSIRFISHQVSSFAFSRQFLVKCGFLAIAAYFILGGKPEQGAFIAGAIPGELDRQETELGVGTVPQTPKKQKKAVVKAKPKKPASEAAPVSRENLRSDRSLDYIKKYSSIARQEMHKYGVPASISLAQGLIESRAGTSKLAVNNNNHFGMKCFSKNCKKGHCSNFTDDTHKDFFLKFGKSNESWRAHSILISSGRYAKLKKYGKDYIKWAKGLKSVGYATDKTYAQKIIGIIERYDLHQYDR